MKEAFEPRNDDLTAAARFCTVMFEEPTASLPVLLGELGASRGSAEAFNPVL
jgi:hypothetical protein